MTCAGSLLQPSAVSSGTSGQGRGCIDMTTPSCGQARGKTTAKKIMNHARAATQYTTRRVTE